MLVTFRLCQPILVVLLQLSSLALLQMVVASTLMPMRPVSHNLRKVSQQPSLLMISLASVRQRVPSLPQQLSQVELMICSMSLRLINNHQHSKSPLSLKVMLSTTSSRWLLTILLPSSLNHSNNSSRAVKWTSSIASTRSRRIRSLLNLKLSRMLSRHSKICQA